jgi:hypothetical protein
MSWWTGYERWMSCRNYRLRKRTFAWFRFWPTAAGSPRFLNGGSSFRACAIGRKYVEGERDSLRIPNHR